MPEIEYTVVGGSRVVANIDSHIARFKDLEGLMVKAAGIVYETTEAWFDSRGEGSWPRLALTTKINKQSQGAMDPARPLYAFGNLWESIVSPNGPYSFFIPFFGGVVFGVDWEKGGYQIPDVLALGTTTSGRGGHTTIPPRPIWPPVDSALGLAMIERINRLMLAGI